jgi:FKBP-type peptidyl-prolyl cis-trans isomerase SlyD
MVRHAKESLAMKRQRTVAVVVCCIFLGAWLGVLAAQAAAEEKPSAVSAGSEVGIEYTLKLDETNVFDTNVGAEPLIYLQGSHQIVPGLEKALEGMKVGESKKVTVQPEEGYGTVRTEAFLEIEKEKVPQEARQVGAQVQGRAGNGQVVRARVTEIKDETVILDFNHPLAGKTLYFEVKILSIQPAAGQ